MTPPIARVVNLRAEPFDVYIGRPTPQRPAGPFGNPFVMRRESDRARVIAEHRAWLRTRPDLVARVLAELPGKRLGCFCHPRPCHGDVLAALANRTLRPEDL